MTQTIRQAIDDAAERLRAARIDNPRLEARLLLAHGLGTTPAGLLRDLNAPAPDSAEPLIARRLAREPLALIIGHREFWSLDFAVSAATLVPRPESETLIESAIDAFAGQEPPERVLDLGTGTGCLLLAALTEFPLAFGVGVDRSPASVALAARNARALHLSDRVTFWCGNWASALSGQFDLVLCNPPYIPTSELDGLMPEVARYEPRSALDGGCDGLAAYHSVIPDLLRLLTPRGVAVLEVGIGQAEAVAALARDAGLMAETRPDLSGIARAVVLRRRLP